MKSLTTVALQLLMYWLLVQPSSQASLQAAPTTLSSSIGRRGREALKKKNELNICDLERRDAPLYCHCAHDIDNATSASCIILNKLNHDDPIWANFTKSQPGLERLDLTVRVGGGMNYVPTKTFRLLKNLTHIDLHYAVINKLVEKAFSDIPSVREIDVSKCAIVQLEKYAFGNLSKLDSINLDDNNIHEINRDVFVNLPTIKKLYINRNNVTMIHDKALKHLTSLETLELNGNKISVITSDTFTGLKSLKSLHLQSNQIEMIGDKTFIEIPELQVLQLDQNKIEFITDNALEGLKNLRKLSLSDNKLVKLEEHVLSGTPSLNFLDLRSNALRTMTFDNIMPIVENFYNRTGYLYLDDNKFICDCKLAWILGVRNETSNKVLKDSLGSLTCFLVSQNGSVDGYEVENNETGIEVKHDSGESYDVGKVKDPANDEDEEEYGDYEDSSPKVTTGKLQKVDGKLGYIKHISELTSEQLPCPEKSEDPLGSERSSSRQENAPITNKSSSLTLVLTMGAQFLMTILTIVFI